MKGLIVFIALVLNAGVSQAAPILLGNTSYATAVSARAGAESGVAANTFPGDPLPLATTTGLLVGADATASATALADTGLLATIAEAVGGFDADADAIASASFFGDFLSGGGVFSLSIDFENVSDTSPGASGSAMLKVLFLADDGFRIERIVEQTTRFEQTFGLAAGITGRLWLDLVSTAYAPLLDPGMGDPGSARLPGSAANGLGEVTFAVNAVPEPGSAMLTVTALALVLFTVPRARSRVARAGRSTAPRPSA